MKLYDLHSEGRLKEAAALWKTLQPLNTLLWTAPFNPVAKAATNFVGGDVGECRRPVEPLSAENMAKVKAAVAAFKR